ncbi:NADH-quinone oxidoreductase subunit L [Hydrogenivirga caldilitoris]|uniref:NADH-quinone oxidoreductase subunit L n=1 Tax=Hydrogenivirga caldilitoris TaxID=246264 RepID=A0A497XQE7_9AQUI|nr:proton-conducting transporter membrane subunit [Hydrogenivirga caldilitoris]RLJ71207.1 NADH-quinone oxidoreductase subunit L [Hydrogenivirga caldilitoris]
MERLVLVTVLLPLVSALVVLLVKSERLFPKISTNLTLLNFLLSLTLLIFGRGESLKAGSLELYTDNLGLLLSTYILLVSLVVHKFSEKYMADEEGYRRFYFLLDLMTGSLVLLVLSANLLVFALCWHLMGFILYYLLSQNLKRKEAVRYANLTFFTHRLADVPLLFALFLLYREFGTFSMTEIFGKALENGSEVLPLVTLLLTLSGMLKSAQFLFHHWIVYTMEGPTPVSALMHAGIVNAGAFLVNRFAPLYTHDKLGLQLAFIAGSITAIVGSVLMLLQSDIKKSLGYSTVGQMGYMVMELGVGAFALAVYHMMAHGIFKATLFLYSGNVIHTARHDPNIPEDEVYTALKRRTEITRAIPWVVYGVLTIAIPLFLVFFSHYIIEERLLEYKTSLVLLFFGWVTAAQVLISVFKLGRERPLLTALMAVLSLTVVLMGYVIVGHSLQKFLYPQERLVERIYEVAFASWEIFLFEVIFMVLVIGVGWFFIYNASRERYLPLYINLYTHFSRELYIHDIYDILKALFLRFASLTSRFSFLPAAGGSALFFLGTPSERDIMLLILALFIPLFPLSLLTSRVLYRFGLPIYLLFPLAGYALMQFYEPPQFAELIATFTFLFHSLRMFTVRNFKAVGAELYCSLMPVLYISESIYLLLAALLPLAVRLLGVFLEREFGTGEITYLKGLVAKMPLFSFLLSLFILLSYSVTLPVMTSLDGVTLLLFIAGSFFLSLALLTNAAKVLWGEPDGRFVYRDLLGGGRWT